jgi:hypothetical protein
VHVCGTVATTLVRDAPSADTSKEIGVWAWVMPFQ